MTWVDYEQSISIPVQCIYMYMCVYRTFKRNVAGWCIVFTNISEGMKPSHLLHYISVMISTLLRKCDQIKSARSYFLILKKAQFHGRCETHEVKLV